MTRPDPNDSEQIRALVRDHYAAIARAPGGGCAPACCGPTGAAAGAPDAARLGYAPEEAAAAPDGADLGLGCGNPGAIARIQPGEVVLDLGAGGGFDCFLAARRTGPRGKVIGVDMTPDMVARARANARAVAAENVEFRLGEIEHLPVADASVDVILSNCVVTLSPDKPAVFREAYRALRPGGRLAIADVVAVAPLPEALAADAAAYAGCAAGAAPIDEVRAMLAAAGFADVSVEVAPGSAAIVDGWAPGLSAYLASARIEARKPAAAGGCCAAGCCA